jgi:predicted O-methyltransferase YrrM
MGDLEDYFRGNKGRLITKWRHYFEIYERHFAPYRARPVRMVEYGVWHGGSLQMWRSYLGPQAHIVGVDRNPECARLAEEGIDVVIGDQADPATHRSLLARYGAFDIVLDDGGHTMEQQASTFRAMYPALRDGGLYVVEDTHSSYNAYWGGGLRQPGTFIEQAKLMIDQLHAWYGPVPGLAPDYVTQTTHGLHFYDSMVVVEKRTRGPPQPVCSGTPTIPMSAEELEFLAEIARGAEAR